MASAHEYFSYNTGKDLLPEGAVKISPSRLSKFFDSTSEWYRTHLLGEEDSFTGSTASVLGTCVHGMAQMFLETGRVDETKVEAYLNSITDPLIDKNYIRMQYPVMGTQLIERYVKYNKGKSETFMHHEVVPGVVVGGSIDLLLDNEIVDYKTTSSTSAPTSIKREYWFQQMAYVWMARKKGMDIRSFRLVYVTTNDVGRISDKTGKPMKDYPTTVTELVHHVTGDDLVLIDGVINLMAESILAFQQNPEIRHLLAQDMRLKEKPKSIFSK